jgi:S-(hydroxymethyl)mycothiol dehydrogenase
MTEVFGPGRATTSWYADCLPSPDFPAYIEFYLQRRLPLDKFVSKEIGLDGVPEAARRMKRDEVQRSVVVL